MLVLAVLTASSALLGVTSAAVAYAPEVPVVPTPKASCGPGSQPETGLQGRVSPEDHASGRAAAGFTCNTELVGSYVEPDGNGTYGGYKVERYVDAQGQECAYYDTTLLFPTDLLDGLAGVNVMDMSDPTEPRLVRTLITPAMLSPHESLVLSQERGVLAAVLGNPLFGPGVVDVYDVSQDCLDPELTAVTPVGILGHESGMSPDGRTFFSASPATNTIFAVGLDDLTAPQLLWQGSYPSHGLSVSDDGNRIYVAGLDGLIILDTTELQARVPNPEVPVVSTLSWDTMSIPQNTIPITVDGDPFLIEIDEFGSLSKVGAGRIIDLADETAPRIISNLRLEVHQPEHFGTLTGDPGTLSPIQGYAGHYCSVPQREDPGIVACSMIVSGLRVFDIRDPHNPREIAYFNAPVQDRLVLEGSSYAMSAPAFVPERGEIWYSDGFSGFYNVRVTNGVWPFTAATPGPGTTAAPTTGVPTTPTPAAPTGAVGVLPATGREVPTVFVVSTAVSAALLLLALSRRGGPAAGGRGRP